MHPEACAHLVEDEYRLMRVGEAPNAFEDARRRRLDLRVEVVADGREDDRRDPPGVRLEELCQLIEVVVAERQDAGGSSRRHTGIARQAQSCQP